MGKKVQPKDTLGILEAIVEYRAEFKQWGDFEDIEIMEWEGFVPDLSDEDFATKKDGYDKLPDEALEAPQKSVKEVTL